jgi:hypothetical protein
VKNGLNRAVGGQLVFEYDSVTCLAERIFLVSPDLSFLLSLISLSYLFSPNHEVKLHPRACEPSQIKSLII